MPADQPTATATRTVFYDDECRFCKVLAVLVLAWDRRGRLAAAPIQGEAGERTLRELTPAQRLASWHFVDETGRVWSAGAAFPPLLAELPGGRPLAHLTGRFPGVTERAYFWVAEHRVALSRFVPGRLKDRAERRLGG